MNDKQYERSKDYRSKYIKKHKGFFGIYCCSYCGKLCSKSKMEVDHIYPINGVKNKASGKLWVKLNTWYLPSNNKGVNETWNTTSACHDCNASKSDSGGLWVWRGYIGRIVFPILNIWLIVGLIVGILNVVSRNNDTALTHYLVLNIVFRILSFLLRSNLIKIPNRFPFTNKRRWK
jgi:hypothetical protein